MTLDQLLCEYATTKRLPTPEEAERFIAEGDLKQVGEAVCYSCALYPRLNRHHAKLRLEHQAALPK